MRDAGVQDEFCVVRLADCLREPLQTGFASGLNNRTGDGVPHLRPMNVSNDGKITLQDLKYVPADKVPGEAGLLRCGDVLFNNTNSPELVGKTALYDLTVANAFSNHMTRIRTRVDVLAPRFCAYVLHQKWREGYFEAICNNHVSQASIGRDKLTQTLIPLPPIEEQRRIVAKLDNLLDRVAATRERLDRVPKIMRKFRKSVLAAAVSGRLTEDWRAEQDGADWTYKPLAVSKIGVRIGPFGSVLHRSDYVSGGVPLVNPTHIRDGLIFPSPNVAVRQDKAHELAAYRLKVGDVVLGRRGEMGRAAVVTLDADGYLCGTGSMILRADQQSWRPRFLSMVLRSPQLVEALDATSVGSTMTNLNQRIVAALELPQVALPEQDEIAKRVDALTAIADIVEKRWGSAHHRFGPLTQAILDRAFRGDL